jgi:hypothetical protein
LIGKHKIGKAGKAGKRAKVAFPDKMERRVSWERRRNRNDDESPASERRRKKARKPIRRADVALIVKESAALKMRGAKFPPNKERF